MAEVRRLQRGSATIPSGAFTYDVVRGVHAGFNAAVNPEKTLLFVTARLSGGDTTALSWRLVDGYTIRLTRTSIYGSTYSVPVEWALVSFSAGVRVQRTSIQLSNNALQGDATILPPLEGHGRFVVSGGWESNLAMPQDLSRQMLHGTLQLLNATTLRAQRQASTDASHIVTYHAQVVDYEGCVVHEVLHNVLSTSATTITRTIPAVDPAKTWILGTDRGTQGTFASTAWHADLADATTLRLRRHTGTGKHVHVVVYVVEFTDGTEVRRHEIELAGTSEGTVTFPSVEPSRSVAMASGLWGGGGASTGTSNHNSAGDASLLYATSELVGTDTHRIRRGNSASTVTYVGQVIQFPAATAAPTAGTGRSTLSMSAEVSLL